MRSFFINLTLFILPKGLESLICRRQCGEDLEMNLKAGHRFFGGPEKKSEEKLRIVNGYEPPPRSFLALIKVNKDESTCGGTIINDRFVLTAGHCVCLYGSDVIPCEDKKLLYPSKNINMYIGVNNKDVSQLDQLQDVQIFHAVDVIMHQNWDGTGHPHLPDLALIQTDRKIKFIDKKVGPICLPSRKARVHNKKVYAAGWGVTGGSCLTDSNGPSKYVRCRKPFSYNGQVFDGCLTSDSPSANNKICQEFLKAIGRNKYNLKTKDAIKIIYSKKKETICYRLENNGHGWCGSCRRDAQENEVGYCTAFDDYQMEDETMTEVSPTQDWGFCSKQCSAIQLEATKLMEINLVALRKRECNLLISNSETLQYDKDKEICAGHKILFPKRRVYRRYKIKGTKDNFFFKRRKSEINRLNITGNASQLNFFLGHADSCQGDSGGPLYRFKKRKGKKRAIIIGVVSRGEQCAGLNQPGIYTNVAKFTKWIRKFSRKGRCN
ncbi:uncharacterized protein [Lepeophtheirus salmonis]|uniref:uncharacterized protein n=1 Tax=Lepeophtheirus salmonis TaxID=72036 RepID=UPI001AEAD5C9|nr:uncharacterized protein LOC121128596 isoform X1 [Lepeophtheirus salmonis]